jgi:hypothetical protein
MAGLDPAIHVSIRTIVGKARSVRSSAPLGRTSSDSPSKQSGVDGRVKPGHDESFL